MALVKLALGKMALSKMALGVKWQAGYNGIG